jgi:hypothetical protein
MSLAFAGIVPLISTAITTNKIIAGVVVLIVIVAAVAWYCRGGAAQANLRRRADRGDRVARRLKEAGMRQSG